MLDNLVAAATGLLVAGLSWRQALPPPLLLTIVFVSSLTFPLSNGGARSLFPILAPRHLWERANALEDRKSTRLNSSHSSISYAVFCLKKKKKKKIVIKSEYKITDMTNHTH